MDHIFKNSAKSQFNLVETEHRQSVENEDLVETEIADDNLEIGDEYEEPADEFEINNSLQYLSEASDNVDLIEIAVDNLEMENDLSFTEIEYLDSDFENEVNDEQDEEIMYYKDFDYTRVNYENDLLVYVNTQHDYLQEKIV